jgi:hypothetical protein
MSADWIWYALVPVAVAAIVLWIVWRKGRPFAAGSVFRASRLSRDNHLFPTQVLITSSTVVQHKPRWIGHLEESVNLAHVASVRIETHLFLSDLYIETSGGSDPIRCHGHRKADAVAMKALIERYQTNLYRTAQ